MGDQDLKFFGEYREEDSICRSMHHLSTASHFDYPTAAAAESPEKRAAAYFNSTKRQAPVSPLREPVSKRATLHFPSSPSTVAVAGDDHHAFGFKRLPLPYPFPASSPPLRRTLSEPIRSPGAVNPAAPPPHSSEPSISPNPVPRQPLHQIPENNIVLQDSFPCTNAAPYIYRTVSDPNPVVNLQLAAPAGTPPHPPRPPLARNAPRSPSCAESPSTKRLRRMKERLKEMSQWWNQVVHEGEEEEDEEPEKDYTHYLQKEESEYEPENPPQKSNQIQNENEMENPSQEAVWVDKNGECLVLHFKCPCGTGYQILLSGNDCYYKLTNF